MKPSVNTLLVLLAPLIPARLVSLGARAVYRIQEVRIAEAAREMLASGDWMVPANCGCKSRRCHTGSLLSVTRRAA